MMLSPSNLTTPQEITFRHSSSSGSQRIRTSSSSTKSIRIQARSSRTAQGQGSNGNMTTSEQTLFSHSHHSPSPSTKLLYDHATWRMYYRIMNARKQRVDELNRMERERERTTNKNGRSTNANDETKNNHCLESQHHHSSSRNKTYHHHQSQYEANALRPNTRSGRASSICSVEGAYSCEPSEDEIFSLDL